MYAVQRYTLNLSDLKWPKTIEDPTKQPCSLRKVLTLLSSWPSVMSLKRGRWLRSNSDTLRWIFQRETSNIRVISSQLKPCERSSTNVSSFRSNFGHPVCPYLLYLVNTMPKRPLVSTLFCLEIETHDSSPKISPGNSWSFRELISY